MFSPSKMQLYAPLTGKTATIKLAACAVRELLTPSPGESLLDFFSGDKRKVAETDRYTHANIIYQGLFKNLRFEDELEGYCRLAAANPLNETQDLELLAWYDNTYVTNHHALPKECATNCYFIGTLN